MTGVQTCALPISLIGLHRAPQIVPERCLRPADVINVRNILALVTPADALGGIPAIYAHKHGIPIVAVRENRTKMGLGGDALGFDNLIEVGNYLEAAGVLLALERGISLASVRRPLPTLRHGLGARKLEKAYRARFA